MGILVHENIENMNVLYFSPQFDDYKMQNWICNEFIFSCIFYKICIGSFILTFKIQDMKLVDNCIRKGYLKLKA